MTHEINSVFVKMYTTSSTFRLNGKESPGAFTLVMDTAREVEL